MEKTYHTNNDEILNLIELWKLAPKNKKSTIQGTIIKKMSYMVKNRICKYKNTLIYQDLFQEGCLGIIVAMEKFDSRRCVNFFHFSTWFIQNRIRVFIKRQNRYRQEIPLEYLPINMEEDDTSLILKRIEDREEILQAFNRLSKKENKVMYLRYGFDNLEPKTFRQIGDIFSISRQRVDQISSRAILKLQDDKILKNSFPLGKNTTDKKIKK